MIPVNEGAGHAGALFRTRWVGVGVDIDALIGSNKISTSANQAGPLLWRP